MVVPYKQHLSKMESTQEEYKAVIQHKRSIKQEDRFPKIQQGLFVSLLSCASNVKCPREGELVT